MSNSPLEQIGGPLYYRAANAADAGFAIPQDRHGQSVRCWVRSLSPMQKEALVTSAMTGASWRLASDEGTYLMGDDIAPNPLTFLSVGMVASYMNEITALARIRDIKLTDVRLTLDNYYYREGDLRKGTMVSGALPPELEVECEADCDDEPMRQLVIDAVAASPLNGLMTGAHDSLFTLTHNGAAIPPGDIGAIEGQPLPDPEDRFPELIVDDDAGIAQPLIDKLMPEAEMVEALKENPVPPPDVGEGRTPLYMSSVCTLRPDGVKEIVKKQYAPTASTWRFISDEADGFGGEGRAPDAASYISAGIAFCFMTQIARYARMAKLPLEAVRVIQDTHFSLGGASGGTGKRGIADPVETHVYMDTGADDDAARDLLHVAERTCFLHAFCRDDLKAKTRFSRRRMAG